MRGSVGWYSVAANLCLCDADIESTVRNPVTAYVSTQNDQMKDETLLWRDKYNYAKHEANIINV